MRRITAAVDRSVEWLIVAIFLAMVLVGGFQVFNRFVLNSSVSWSEEFQRYGQVWLVFLGIPLAYKKGMHIGMDTSQAVLAEPGKRGFLMLIDALWFLLGAVILVGLYHLSAFLGVQRSAGLAIPMTWAYGGMAIGAAYMIFVSVRRIGTIFLGRHSDLPDWR